MRTSRSSSPKAQHPKSLAIHKLQADYPIFRGSPYMGRCIFPIISDANDPLRS